MGKIIITKPYGYNSLDDASELELKTVKTYSELLHQKNYSFAFKDLKYVDSELVMDNYSVLIVELSSQFNDDRSFALSKFINMWGNLGYFSRTNLLLITSFQGLIKKELRGAFTKFGTFLYLKPVRESSSFLITLENCYLLSILGHNLQPYFKVGPVTKEFERFLIEKHYSKENVYYFRTKTEYDFTSFKLTVDEKPLFTSVDRYYNIYTDKDNFTKLNLWLMERRSMFEKTYKKNIDINLAIK